jgi:hypothetical protein
VNQKLRLFSADSGWRADLAALVQESTEFVRMLTVSVRKLRSPVANANQPRRRTAASQLRSTH